MATPSSSRSRPAVQVFCAKASIPYRARWGPSSPHRTPEATTSSCSRSRSSVRKPNLRLTGAVAQRSSSALASIRDSASPTSRATVASSGLSCRSERSASRTRSRCPGCSASASALSSPKVAAISGAKVSMSGHMTTMSRGSRVGSSASSPTSSSRSTSTWRSGPCEAWNWMLRSSCSRRWRWSSAASSRFAARSDCSRASRVPRLGPPPCGGPGMCRSTTAPSPTARARTSCSSRESRPR